MQNKTIIIGIDGVPYELMDNLSEKGVMPHFQKLKKQGIFKKMHSSVPHISSVSWSTIITGKNPAQHGIFGFTDILPGTYSLRFPDFNSLQKPAFWHKNDQKKYIILNVPATYPAQKLNGVHVSGFISLDLENAVSPKKYLPKLKKLNYQVDVDSSIAHKSKTLFLKKLFETLDARIKAYRYFWDKENWDVFMLVFTGSDRLEHFLWDAYEDKNHKFHPHFLKYFQKVDKIIGEINSKITKKDNLVLLSDHGMEAIKINVNINHFLKQRGFLDLDPEQKGYNQITENTQAFALDPGRIYLHKIQKYPRGTITKEKEESILNKLKQSFLNLKHKGQKVIKKIHHKKEIYQGPLQEQAPDLVLIENPGYRLKGKIDPEMLFEKDIFTGKHTPDDAFLYVKHKENKTLIPQNPAVENFLSIINKL